MTVMFLHMWNVIANSSKPIDHELHLPHHFHPDSFESDGYVQPTVIHLLMEKLLVKMFTSTSLTVPANMYISARLI